VEQQYILTIDQSTSASKAILFDRQGRGCARENVEHRQIYPQAGWVEHDAEEIYRNVCHAVSLLKQKHPFTAREILALSISNQRETLVVWEKATGRPIHPAIVWQCQRAEALCAALRTPEREEMIRQKTGLILSPYFSAAKLAWILEQVPHVRERAERGELLMGTIDSWLIWKLSGHTVHATDHSNACRTLLFNIHTLDWDDELLALFGVPRAMLPVIRSAGDVFAHTDVGGALESPIPICGVMGDSNGALFGQNCFEKGTAKITYGTGSSVMMNVGEKPIRSKQGLLSSVAWKLDDQVSYVLDGNITCTGATIKWMVDDLQLIDSAGASQALAESIPDNGGVYLVPAFSGLGAPYWNSHARASITGLSLSSKKAHIARAGLEAIVYQIDDVLQVMKEESGLPLNDLRVDGGPTHNDFLMQFQADISRATVIRSHLEELSAIGTAYLAGLRLGFWDDYDAIRSLRSIDRAFAPQMADQTRTRNKAGWVAALRSVLHAPPSIQ